MSLTPAGHFIFERAFHFPEKLRGSTPLKKFLSALNYLVVIDYTSIKLHLKKENRFDSLPTIIYVHFSFGIQSIYAREGGLCSVIDLSTSAEQMTRQGSGSDLWHLLST